MYKYINDIKCRRLIILFIGILLIIFYLRISSVDYTQSNERTVAIFNPSKLNNFHHVLYVISLDGKITAIDVYRKGHQLWIANTGEPLVNSSLSKIEISRNSKSIRLIPSLIGGLYEKYEDEEHMESLPFDTETLLNTSSHFHDELIMTGGKYVDTLGIDLHTGKIVYSFETDDYTQTTCSAPILVIKRIKQTVRARSVRTGHEKWNFSVSNHELIRLFSPSSNEFFEHYNYHSQRIISKVYFEYQLQTGVIFAFDHEQNLLWTSSINNPIAAVWELKNGRLKEKSLFKSKLSRHLAFMGEFNSTPYVIISPRLQQQLIHHARKINIPGASNTKRPVLSSWYKIDQQQVLSISSDLSTHNYPIAVRQKESKDITGYLALIDPIKSIIEEEKHALWFHSIWILSSICLGILIIVVIRYLKQEPVVVQRQESRNNIPFEQPFQSRYIVEYDHVRFLGRGGFGVVFEAKNKLDERRVAIKRVSFKKSSGKEQALKEIRCLAVLNHPNLIQYYYAWNECPPKGWQDEEDKKLIMKDRQTTDSLSTFPTSTGSEESNEPINQLPSVSSLPPVIDFTFERSLNPPQIHEDSNSSLFEHSYDSSHTDDDDQVQSKPIAETDCPTTYFYFVMELCQSESLRDRLIKQTIDQSKVWVIFDQIIQGIEYIHSQKLIHRDLKPSNILFSMENIVKIGDFGLVSAFGEDKIENVDALGNNEGGGTILYMSPEQINRQSYNQKIDIYAIGIILFELLYPFSTQMERICALKNIRLQIPIFPKDFESNELNCRLIRWLLAHSPHDRPKACEFRQDSSYQDILQNENLF